MSVWGRWEANRKQTTHLLRFYLGFTVILSFIHVSKQHRNLERPCSHTWHPLLENTCSLPDTRLSMPEFPPVVIDNQWPLVACCTLYLLTIWLLHTGQRLQSLPYNKLLSQRLALQVNLLPVKLELSAEGFPIDPAQRSSGWLSTHQG